jgi:hypothetical protein
MRRHLAQRPGPSRPSVFRKNRGCIEKRHCIALFERVIPPNRDNNRKFAIGDVTEVTLSRSLLAACFAQDRGCLARVGQDDASPLYPCHLLDIGPGSGSAMVVTPSMTGGCRPPLPARRAASARPSSTACSRSSARRAVSSTSPVITSSSMPSLAPTRARAADAKKEMLTWYGGPYASRRCWRRGDRD